jgi:RND family efflux transporter MFP subunit
MPVVRLSENGLLRLTLPVPESAVPLVHPGEQVEVKVPALHRSFAGRVARFADKVDESTRTMKTEVDVPNPKLELVPGMYAQVDLTTAQRRNALSIPVEAIDGSGSSTQVFAVRDGQVQVVPVQLGIETANRAEVTAGDLKDDDDVVIGSRAGLKAGAKVQPKVTVLAAAAPKS